MCAAAYKNPPPAFVQADATGLSKTGHRLFSVKNRIKRQKHKKTEDKANA